MRLHLREYQRRGIVPLAAVALAAYYLMVFLPVKRRADTLDAPLEKVWQKLAASLQQSNAMAVDFRQLTNQLAETRQALALLEAARQKTAARLQMGAAVRARMTAPFELVDFESDRNRTMNELSRLAKQQQVSLEPPVFSGFPEHTADMKQPALLWAALAMVDGLLRTAIQCQVAVVHSIDTPTAPMEAVPASGVEHVVEVPVQMEFTGPAGSVGKLLQSLPLRLEEARATGLAGVPIDKPPLFIERLILKKQSPDKPDEVRVSLRVLGFVWRD